MMKETELRIGNLIFFNDENNTVCAIESIKRDFDDEPYSVEIKFKDGTFSDINIEDINPIPLTEEWLVTLGLTQNGNDFYTENGSGIMLNKRKDDFGVWKNTINHGGVLIKTSILFVHEFQNLYFALTGEELTIQEYSIK